MREASPFVLERKREIGNGILSKLEEKKTLGMKAEGGGDKPNIASARRGGEKKRRICYFNEKKGPRRRFLNAEASALFSMERMSLILEEAR